MRMMQDQGSSAGDDTEFAGKSGRRSPMTNLITAQTQIRAVSSKMTWRCLRGLLSLSLPWQQELEDGCAAELLAISRRLAAAGKQDTFKKRRMVQQIRQRHFQQEEYENLANHATASCTC